MVEELEQQLAVTPKVELSMALDTCDVENIKETKSRKEFERLAKKIFAAADLDNSGFIDKDEMLKLIQKLAN